MRLKLAIATLMTIGSAPVFADASDNYLSCSAHFEARAIWGETVGSDVGYVNGMKHRAELLFTAFETANPIQAEDWGMNVMGSMPISPSAVHQRDLDAMDAMTEDTMIYFAELAPMSGQAPLCAEDAICQVCSDVLRSSME